MLETISVERAALSNYVCKVSLGRKHIRCLLRYSSCSKKLPCVDAKILCLWYWVVQVSPESNGFTGKRWKTEEFWSVGQILHEKKVSPENYLPKKNTTEACNGELYLLCSPLDEEKTEKLYYSSQFYGFYHVFYLLLSHFPFLIPFLFAVL